jgi:hypothetical protein
MCVVSGFTAGTKALISPVTAIMMVAIAPIEAEVKTADETRLEFEEARSQAVSGSQINTRFCPFVLSTSSAVQILK